MHWVEASAAAASFPSRALYVGQDQMTQQGPYGVGGSVADGRMGLGVGVESELWGAIGFVPGVRAHIHRIVGRPRFSAGAEQSKKAEFYFLLPLRYTSHLSFVLYPYFMYHTCVYVSIDDCGFR